MHVSAQTLARMRRAAVGTLVVAASGVALAAGPGQASETPPTPVPAEDVLTTEPVPAEPLPVEPLPVREPVPVSEPLPPPVDAGDCPGCGLG